VVVRLAVGAGFIHFHVILTLAIRVNGFLRHVMRSP